jgi:hypothetical protein
MLCPVASYSIMDPAKVGRIAGLLNALDARGTTYDPAYGLGVAGIAHNQVCPGVAGPTANSKFFHPQLALTGPDVQRTDFRHCGPFSAEPQRG